MRSLVLILLTLSAAAHAQFGTGLYPGSSCGNQFGPAQGAFAAQDEVRNIQGQLRARDMRVAQLQRRENLLDDRLSRAKSKMARVITAKGFRAIREHRERNNSYGSYRRNCSQAMSAVEPSSSGRAPADIGGGRAPADERGGTTDAEVFDDGGEVRAGGDEGQYPPPPGFCITNPATGRVTNVWEKFVEDDGTVSDRLCNFRISGITASANRADQEDCRQGMHEYYAAMSEKKHIRDQIDRFETEARRYERRLERIEDEITDGTYCAHCAAQRRGYSQLGAGNSMGGFGSILSMLSQSMMRPQQPMMMGGPRPPMMGGPMMGPQVMPMGGPGYLPRPYTAQMPGYPMVMPGPRPGLGQYGGMPGGIGPGGFGCQGANPAAFGQPFGSPMMNPIYGGNSPFNNPFANPMMNPMFNQGAGPWGYPQYANGMPGFMDPYGNGANPFNMYNQNPFMNPMARNPYGMNPYAMNPYAMGPYGQNPYAMGPYGMSPYGPGNPFGGGYNPYAAPGMMPYMGYNPYGGIGGYGMPYGPGYGSPYGGANYGYGNVLGNYLGQVNLLNNRLQYIQGGGYYGGGGGAPAYAPYIGTPNYQYNYPGQYSYPGAGSLINTGGVRGNAPAYLPYTR